MAPDWTFVTSNQNKVKEAQAILHLDLRVADLDLEEVQGLDLKAIVQHKLTLAYEALKVPVIVEDTGLFLEGYGGFPGPLVKWLLKGAGSAGLCAMAEGIGNRNARAVCAIGARDGEQRIYVEGIVEGIITPAPRGTTGFGWDNVFQPGGSDLTYAEMGEEEKNKVSHRFKAFQALRENLTLN